MGDDITIGVTEIVNNIEVTAQPNDQIVDISVTDNADNVTLNITPTVVEVNINKGSSFAQWGDLYGTLSDQTDLQNALNLKANLVDGKVPASELPSYVDDIIEVANYAALPTTGEIGKIYVTLDNNKIYRWSGSIYIEIASNSAIWGAITGTLTDQTDLVTALNAKQNTITLTTTGTTGAATLVGSTLNIPNYTTDISGLVPYTGATTNVDLGSHKLTASDLVINHASGSGVAASITKGGNGEALTVVKSSGSGNAASITGGTTLISELHLTTDLSDDYIASAATWNAKQDALTNPVTGTGLQNFVTKWTGIGSAIVSSKIFDDGTNVGIGSINPSSLLELEKNNATGGGFLNIINTNSAMTGKIADINFKIGDSFGIPVDAAYIQAIPANANVSTGASLSFFTRKGNADPTASFTINNVGAVTINNLAGTGSRMVIANSTGQLSTQAITLGTVTSVSALTIGTTGTDITSTVANETTTPVITLNVPTASASNRGALSSADWTTFNSKQSALSGTGFVKISGSTISYDNSTYVPTSRTLTINGTAYDLSADRSWTISAGVSGTGTTNYIPKFTGASAIGDSLIYDNNTNVGIGTASPSYILQTKASSGFVGAAFSSSYAATSIIGNDANSSWFGQGTNGLGSAYVINNTSGYAQIELGGSPRFYVNSSGNVGIGTTSPASKLDVAGAIRITGVDSAGYQFEKSSDNTNFYLSYYTTSAKYKDLITFNYDGNVGIGTASPNNKLHVAGTVQFEGAAGTDQSLNITTSGVQNTFIGFNNSGSTNSWGALNNHSYIANANSYGLVLATGNLPRLVITSGGNVGIGTASPSQKLHVDGSAYFNTDLFTGNNGGIFFSGNSTFTSGILQNAAGLCLQSGGQLRLAISSGGNVGINTTSPESGWKFDVAGIVAMGSTAGNGRLYISCANTTNGITYIQARNLTVATPMSYLASSHSFDSNVTVSGVVSASGNGGFASATYINGSRNPIWRFGNADGYGFSYFQGTAGIGGIDTIGFHFGTATAAASQIQFIGNGSAVFSGSVTAASGFFNSDIRLKEIIDYDYNISNIKPITYLWKDGRDNKKHVGYSAQEVQKVMPDAVNEDEKGFLSVNYVEVLVAKMEAMEKEIAYLKSKI